MGERWPRGAPRDEEERYRFVFQEAFRVAYRLSRNATEAEDLAQDTCISVESWLDKYAVGEGEEIRSFAAWVRRVAKNKAINRYHSAWQRVLRRRIGSDPSLPSVAAGPEAAQATRELEARLDEELAKLTPGQREAFELGLRGYSMQEIADIASVPLGTAKVRLHRAKKALARRIQALFKER